MLFEWDDEKEKINIKKHGISFETASFVFLDKNRKEYYDEEHSSLEEDRFITIGKVKDVLFVVYTDVNDITRIISARLADSDEKRDYYGNC